MARLGQRALARKQGCPGCRADEPRQLVGSTWGGGLAPLSICLAPLSICLLSRRIWGGLGGVG